MLATVVLSAYSYNSTKQHITAQKAELRYHNLLKTYYCTFIYR